MPETRTEPKPDTRKIKGRFRVLEGVHAERDANGDPRFYGKYEPLGDIVESVTDLVAKYNKYGTRKFERVDDSATPNYPETVDGAPFTPKVNVPQPPSAAPKMPPLNDETLKSMTLDQLQKEAAAEGIDLGKHVNDRDAIIKRLKAGK